MTTKQYLAQGKQTEQRIQQQMRVLSRSYKKIATGKEPMEIEQTPGELQANLNQDLENLLAHRKELGTLIAQLPDQNHRGVLTLRYLCGLRWEQIARRMHYSSRHLHRVHIRALQELEKHRSQNMWS